MGNADQIAQECGGRRYGAVTQVQDHMLHDRQIPMEMFVERVAHDLAHKIMEDMPDNLMVQRKTPEGYPPGFYGFTEYRTDIMVFSLKSFDKFVERLLSTYGNQYADAAMLTKKAKLRDTITKLSQGYAAERDKAVAAQEATWLEVTSGLLTSIDQL